MTAKAPKCLFKALLFSAIILMAGCNNPSSLNGPPPAFDIDQDISDLQTQYQSATSIKNYYAAGPETKQRRDEFVVGRLTLYNLQYIKYISQFTLESAQLQSAFDITKLGVDLAITLVGGAATKAILGAVSAGLTGTRLSIEKNFFNEKTAQALVTQMNAQRKVALVPIVAGLQEDVSQYPLSSAIVDLQTYYEAGTMTGALQAILADAGTKDAEATKLIDQYRTTAYGPGGSSVKILDWIWPGFKTFDDNGHALDAAGKVIRENQEHYTRLSSWLADNGFAGLPTATFLNNRDLEQSRQDAIRALGIP
jgi:hypothetical protein